MDNLDSDLLRTFLAVAQAGSVTEGAERIHRSQSATSVQIRRLEAIVGQPVFERHGRGVALSEAGRRLLPVARDVTARLDTALRALSDTAVAGKIRLAIPDDHGRTKLTRIIAAFAQRHPQVELEVTCALSTGFPEALKKGDLDLAIYEVEALQAGEELLSEDPTCWLSALGQDFSTAATLPVALFDQACWWRDEAVRSLDARGGPYRIVYSSQSVSGVLAAVEAGIAVGLLGRSSLHAGLTIVDRTYGFAPTPTSKLVMAEGKARAGAPLATMKSAIRAAFLGGNPKTESRSDPANG